MERGGRRGPWNGAPLVEGGCLPIHAPAGSQLSLMWYKARCHQQLEEYVHKMDAS